MITRKRNEDLVVGDVIHLWCGTKRITKIEPYKGSLSDIIFAIVEYTPSATQPHGGLSLELGGYTEVVV